ncbi:MAG TPA: hypothetical protein VH394_26170 [Thermoanaerobaculia bacterium]|jgi:hypothetical protein|nr:hypothetical protein [Thermoanaerobaculia bacterium]
MYEKRTEPLLSRREFALRLAWHGGVSLALIAGSLLMGATGYHVTEGLAWLDAMLNAAMILTGMGPVTPLRHVSGKLFATFYALYSGVAFLAITGLLVAPVAHRLLHRLHVDESEDS